LHQSSEGSVDLGRHKEPGNWFTRFDGLKINPMSLIPFAKNMHARSQLGIFFHETLAQLSPEI